MPFSVFRGVKKESFASYTNTRGSKTDDLQPRWEMKAQISKTCLLLSFTDGDIKQWFKLLLKQSQSTILYGDRFSWVVAPFQTLNVTNFSLIRSLTPTPTQTLNTTLARTLISTQIPISILILTQSLALTLRLMPTVNPNSNPNPRPNPDPNSNPNSCPNITARVRFVCEFEFARIVSTGQRAPSSYRFKVLHTSIVTTLSVSSPMLQFAAETIRRCKKFLQVLYAPGDGTRRRRTE